MPRAFGCVPNSTKGEKYANRTETKYNPNVTILRENILKLTNNYLMGPNNIFTRKNIRIFLYRENIDLLKTVALYGSHYLLYLNEKI